MIHHISIPAENPLHVAKVLAEVLSGTFGEFPPHRGSYITFAVDAIGTAIEVYPRGTELIPGSQNQAVQFQDNNQPSRFIATHAAISVPCDEEKITQIALREGWRVVRCDRDGLFEVIEFWIENAVMLELLTQEMALKYIQATDPQKLANFWS